MINNFHFHFIELLKLENIVVRLKVKNRFMWKLTFKYLPKRIKLYSLKFENYFA